MTCAGQYNRYAGLSPPLPGVSELRKDLHYVQNATSLWGLSVSKNINFIIFPELLVRKALSGRGWNKLKLSLIFVITKQLLSFTNIFLVLFKKFSNFKIGQQYGICNCILDTSLNYFLREIMRRKYHMVHFLILLDTKYWQTLYS